MAGETELPLLDSKSIVSEMGEVPYHALFATAASPPHKRGSLVVRIHSPGQHFGARIVKTGEMFCSIKDYVQFSVLGEVVDSIVLEMNYVGAHTLYMLSYDCRTEGLSRRQLCAVGHSDSIYLTSNKERLYLFDHGNRRAEVLDASTWKRLASGAIIGPC